MIRRFAFLFAALAVAPARAGQAPGSAASPDIPVSARDRVYAGEQFSNTVSVIDPAANKLLGVIRLGDLQPTNLSPLYRGQLLVHGLGFSPDHRTLVVVSIASNSATFIDTATNAVKHITYLGRSPHEAFFTPDGREVWVTVRGEDYVAVLDGKTFSEKRRIKLANGPGMTIFSPDGKYGYVCSSFTPETAIVSVAGHKIVDESAAKLDLPGASADYKKLFALYQGLGTLSDMATQIKAAGTTLLVVEQNASAALKHSDRGYVLETGEVILEGTAATIASNPRVREAYLGE